MPAQAFSPMENLDNFNVLEQQDMWSPPDQNESPALVMDYNDKLVRIPGYMMPLELAANGVIAFILAPYIGACIHVPPPPANRLVFVTSETPYQVSGLFEAVNVTGVFGTASTSTQYAEIGYVLPAERIEPYEE